MGAAGQTTHIQAESPEVFLMKRLLISALALALLAWTAAPSEAAPRVRGHRQGHRIGQGVHNGSMTGRETFDATRDLNRIRKRDNYFRSDGIYSRGERFRTHNAMDRSSNQIFRYKHNDRNR